jgi:hypothetical protein
MELSVKFIVGEFYFIRAVGSFKFFVIKHLKHVEVFDVILYEDAFLFEFWVYVDFKHILLITCLKIKNDSLFFASPAGEQIRSRFC